MEHAEDDLIVGEIIDDDISLETPSIGTPVDPRHAAFALAALAVAAMFVILVLQNLVFDSIDQPQGPQGDYERVPVWERAEWPYITDGPHGFVM